MSEETIKKIVLIQLSNYVPGECPMCNFKYERPEQIQERQGIYLGKVSGIYVLPCKKCWEKVKK